MPEPPLRLPATPESLLEAAAGLERFCAAEAVSRGVAWRLRVALDEILSNVVRHGGGTQVEISFRRDEGVAEITVADDGVPFDPAAWPEPDVQSPLEERRPGGVGLALVRHLVDEIDYHRRDGNVLRLRLRLDPARGTQETNS